MRYTIAEGVNILGKFGSGDTVTISLYDISDEGVITLSSNSCNEIGSTGVFKWSSSNIATQPTAFIEYLWVMDNSTYEQYGKIVLGGYPDDVLADTNELQGNQADWATAAGFAIPNEYDTELTNIQTDVHGLNGAAMRGTNSVPTNPLLTNDVRLGNLDATISSRSDHTAADVWNEDRAKYLLGLVQHNFRLKDQVYNGSNMTSATLRIYNNAADCTNDVNPLKEYSIVATYDGNNNCISYRVTE